MNTIKVKDAVSELKKLGQDSYLTVGGGPFGDINGNPGAMSFDISVPALDEVKEEHGDLEDENSNLKKDKEEYAKAIAAIESEMDDDSVPTKTIRAILDKMDV